jgi:hypothetical protein
MLKVHIYPKRSWTMQGQHRAWPRRPHVMFRETLFLAIYIRFQYTFYALSSK